MTSIVKMISKIKLHIMSDIHLEFLNVSCLNSLSKKIPSLFLECKFDKKETILVLAGDIGYPSTEKYWKFIEDCSLQYYKVILITGNHEYYNTHSIKHYKFSTSDKILTIEETDILIKEKIKKYINCYFLQKDAVIIDGFTFLGTTLWSNIPIDERKNIEYVVNDYKYIYKNANTNVSAKDTTEIHNDQLDWLNKNITDNCIIITHHLPTKRLSHEKYEKYKLYNSAFMTELNEMFTDKIKMWICGHTHTPMSYVDKVTGIHMITNPLGYEKENINSKINEIEL
jgi:predicted phosphodiesterase